ncbi:cytochrome P450 [Amylocarpus encephaloides]|uniref:Cytochrome P450 n=1 Tax=Amylocarpus encephaloides TaxID=45428 RepID=A0A9P8C833_9HELO|nr:cytochrome P450 [Amylocarpus encephaloides]
MSNAMNHFSGNLTRFPFTVVNPGYPWNLDQGRKYRPQSYVGLFRDGFDGWLPYCLVTLLIVAYELRRMIVVFRNRRPQNVKVIGMPSIFGNWLTSIRYCYASQEVHNKAYKEGKGEPYAIPTRRRYQVCVSSQKLVEEFSTASIHQVSLRHALWERAFPEQTIDGLSVDNIDKNGSLSQKVFRHQARLHLPSMQSLLQQRLDEGFASEIDSHKTKGEWMYISSSGALNRLVTKINNIIIVGDELAQNQQFFESIVKYIMAAGICEEVLQFTPKAIAPMVGWMIMRGTRIVQNVNKFLIPLAHERAKNRDSEDKSHKDTVEWIMKARPKASPEEVAQQTLAYVFGGAYQMPILLTFSLYNLCKHPEYLEQLREEIARSNGVHFNHENDEMPLLDSFLKETARMNPVTIFGMPRKIMHDYTFSDGTHVPADNWIVVPQQAQMKDPLNYANPEKFDGFRFVKDVGGQNPTSESRLSHPSWRFPFWGSVRQACPARFYVTDMTKLFLKDFIMNYDIKLSNENLPSSFAWGPIRVPHPRLAFLMKQRSH